MDSNNNQDKVQDLYALEGKILGKGSFGTVYLGVNLSNDQYVALKKIPAEILNDQQKINSLSNEILISSEVESQTENLVTILNITYINNDGYLVYEFSNGGDLRRYLRFFQKFNENLVQYFMRQVLNGLSVLHKKKIIHHDIKPENILVELVPEDPNLLGSLEGKKKFEKIVDGIIQMTNKKPKVNMNYNNNFNFNNNNNNNMGGGFNNNYGGVTKEYILQTLKRSKMKLSDFGLSKYKEDNNQKMLSGSPLYMDPCLFEPDVKIEVIENEKVDIWAIGILAFELFTGRRPFNSPSQSLKELIQVLKQGVYRISLSECGKISKQFLSFLNMCLQRQQKIRPNIEELLYSEFITREPECFEYIDINNIFSVKFPNPGYVSQDIINMSIDDQRSVNANFDF